MKTFMLVPILFLSVSGMAADLVECVNSRGDKVSLTKHRDDESGSKGKVRYEMTADQNLLNRLIAGIHERIVALGNSRTTDILEDWDGKSRVSILMHKGFLQESAGSSSNAFFKSEYDATPTYSTSHVLVCIIIK